MIEIRVLTPDDADQWWRLRLEGLERDPEAFGASAEEHRSLSLDEVRKRLHSEGGDSFVVGALDQGRLLGMAGFHRDKGLKTRHKGHVWGVYVTSEQRGKGVGRTILENVLQRGARIDGVQQILISVATTQSAATRLYKTLGFESFGREPQALKVGDRFIDEEHMVLRVKPFVET